jgi:hypothetical protein
MSAVTPAPEDGSYPEILNTIGLVSGIAAVYTAVKDPGPNVESGLWASATGPELPQKARKRIAESR